MDATIRGVGVLAQEAAYEVLPHMVGKGDGITPT